MDLLRAWVAEKGARLRLGYRSPADLALAREYFGKMDRRNQLILDSRKIRSAQDQAKHDARMKKIYGNMVLRNT
jgi:hypothetical protein